MTLMMSHSAQSSDISRTQQRVTTPSTTQPFSAPLSSTQEDFSAIFQAAPSPFLLLKPDSQFTIVNVNEAYLKATMTKREDILGKGIFTAFPDNPSDQSATGVRHLRASLQRVVQNRQTDVMHVQKYDIPKPREKEGGFEERYWIPTNTPVFDKEEKLAFIIHHVQDVTEFEQKKQQEKARKIFQRRPSDVEFIRDDQKSSMVMEGEVYVHTKKAKEAEERANEINARYRLLTSTLPVGVFHTDLEDHCLYVNSRWEELTEAKLSQFTNKPWTSLIHPGDQKRVTEHLQQCRKIEMACSIEFRIVLSKKQERWVLVQLVPEKDLSTQKIKGYIGSMTDINAQKELEASEKKRAQTLEDVNRIKTEFFNNISHEFRTPLTLILGVLESMLTDASNTLTSVQQERLAMLQHHALRVLKLVNSLLDFARIETKRIQARYQPTDLAKLTSELVNFFTTAFEKAQIQLKLDIKPINEVVYIDQEMWEKIVLNLISNALKYTPKGSVTISLQKQGQVIVLNVKDTGVGIPETDLPHLFERFYRAKNIQGRSVEGVGIGLSLTHELVKLHGGFMKVESREGVGSMFTVAIPLGKLHLPQEQTMENETSLVVQRWPLLGKIFTEEMERWIQDEKSEKKEQKREASEGKETKETKNLKDTKEVKVEEVTSSGKPVKVTQPSSEMAASQCTTPKKKKILLADDNKDLRGFITRELSPYWEVVAVANGEEALKTALQVSPDLVLSDVMMPKMDGFELARALRKDHKTKMIPIILMSAKSGDEAQIEALAQGVDDYIVKPFTRRELVARIQSHIELGGARMALEKKVEEQAQRLGREIEEHRQTAAHLRTKEENYQLLTAISPAGIFRTNEKGYTTYLNPKACEIIGISLDKATHENWSQAVHAEDQERVRATWRKMIAEKGEFFKSEHRFVHADQKTIWALAQAVPEKDSSQQIRGYVGTLTDITDSKLLEKAKEDAVQRKEAEDKRRLQLAEEQRQKSEAFVDTLCHELRNPANGIYGNVSLLETLIPFLEKLARTTDLQQLAGMVKNFLPKQITDLKEVTSSIEKCVKYQKCLLDDMLSVSKLESGKIKLEEVESNIKSILQDVISMFSADINQKKLQIFTLLPQAEVRIKVDANRLSQILINLLSNAIKFTPPNGKITLGFSPKAVGQEEVELEFCVKDSGIGISREEQSRLFNRFEQVGRNTSREYGSSGLGLVICKNLVTLMRGKIEIESEPSKGTKCRFTIRCSSIKPAESPVERRRGNAVASKTAVTPSSPEQKLNILVVEDNLINQKLLVRLIERAGHSCKVANNGREAVDIATLSNTNQIPFDAILMDIEMPLMNGLDATVEIRAREKKLPNQFHTVPIIAISGYSSEEYMQRARMVGMNDFFTKPYEINKIISKVKEWIAQLSKSHSLERSPSATGAAALSSMQPGSSSSFLTSSSTSSATTASPGSEKSNPVSFSLPSTETRSSASYSFFTSSSSSSTSSTVVSSEKDKQERVSVISARPL